MKKRKKEKEKKGKKFRYGIKCILISRVLVWRLVAPCSKVLWRDHPNPRIVEVMWVKPQLVKNKHGIHHNSMVLYGLVDFSKSSWIFT